jgi:hypothetical protein
MVVLSKNTKYTAAPSFLLRERFPLFVHKQYIRSSSGITAGQFGAMSQLKLKIFSQFFLNS